MCPPGTDTSYVLAQFQDFDQTACTSADFSVVSTNWGDGSFAPSHLEPGTSGNFMIYTELNAGVCTVFVVGTHLYWEESEPNVPYQITIIVKDTFGGSTTTLHSLASVLDSALSNDAGPAPYAILDPTTTFPPGATTGPNNPTGACWLLTKCTRLIATFTDASTTCATESLTRLPPFESLTASPHHYAISIDWGDGSPADTNPNDWSVVPTATAGLAPCTFDVYGTHFYTTPYPMPNGGGSPGAPFIVATTITDEGNGDCLPAPPTGCPPGAVATTTTGVGDGSAASISVGEPPTTVPVHTPTTHAVVNYSYPPGSIAPTYFLSLNIYHYVNLLGFVGHLDFQDAFHYQNSMGLYIPKQPIGSKASSACVTTFSFTVQCQLVPLSLVCIKTGSGSSTVTNAALFAEYNFKVTGQPSSPTLHKFVRIDMTQAGLLGKNDDFTVWMSNPAQFGGTNNFPVYVQSRPPIKPINQVQLTC
jgi:hypothetical protein